MAYAQRTIHTLYKKLLRLYPQTFREQLGESMQQTFDDLYNERQTKRGLFGFVLWMFIETAIGIVQEHILSIKEMNPMNNMLTNLRSSAVVGFLIVLPFILLEFTFVILKRLTFDLRDALDSVVIFGILWLGVAAILLILMPLVRSMQAGNNSAANPVPAQGNSILTNPASAAMIGFLLALPFVTLLSLLLLGIEPPLGPLTPLFRTEPDQPNYLSLFIVLGAFLLAITGCIIARAPIVRAVQAGRSLFTHPINLMLAIVILFFLTKLVVGLIVDQFPCWIGVPNCD
ncbi:MAG: hypothetical protein EHM40_15135 [Chloroflexi bacterium]|nr:MAG: hypothetical protein EHM40_15135 [Chloroflexota bacterium]